MCVRGRAAVALDSHEVHNRLVLCPRCSPARVQSGRGRYRVSTRTNAAFYRHLIHSVLLSALSSINIHSQVYNIKQRLNCIETRLTASCDVRSAFKFPLLSVTDKRLGSRTMETCALLRLGRSSYRQLREAL